MTFTFYLAPDSAKKTKIILPVCSLSFILPALQGLVGEKYGSIRVPGEVDSAEFEMILDAAVEAGMDTHILEEWYCRDENSVPPAYYLKPKAQMLKNYQNSVSLASFEKNCAFATNWKIISLPTISVCRVKKKQKNRNKYSTLQLPVPFA